MPLDNIRKRPGRGYATTEPDTDGVVYTYTKTRSGRELFIRVHNGEFQHVRPEDIPKAAQWDIRLWWDATSYVK